MLAAYLDVAGKLIMSADSVKVDAELKGLRLETAMELDQQMTHALQSSGQLLHPSLCLFHKLGSHSHLHLQRGHKPHVQR